MGAHGPVPKRSAERAGHRAKADKPDTVKMHGPVRPPGASRDWCSEARRWYRALTRSGQAKFYEPSDWEYARIVARLLTDELAKGEPLRDDEGGFVLNDEGRPVMNGRRSSEMVKAILAAMDNLLSTEGARRRVRLEVDRMVESTTTPAKVAVLEEYRTVAGSS